MQQADRPSAPIASDDERLAPTTQIVGDREEYLGQNANDIGRRISPEQVELFVTDDAAFGLQQQLARVAPEYIAVHDIGTNASLRLLTALASASKAPMQRLTIRRQGQGMALAAVPFVELPNAGGQTVRLYTTDFDGDAVIRRKVAVALLAHSRLGVLLLSERPQQALGAALQPLHDAIVGGAWPNRDLLLLPLGPAQALATQAAQLVGHSGVTVRITPQAARLNDAWGFISGAWNRMHGTVANVANVADGAAAAPAAAAVRRATPATEPSTQQMPLDPRPMPVPGGTHWADYLRRCAAIKGVLSCCVLDVGTQRPLAEHGGPPSGERMAAFGIKLIEALNESARGLGLGSAPPQAALSFGTAHWLIRPVPGHPGIVLLLVLQASSGNLTLARMQLEQIEP